MNKEELDLLEIVFTLAIGECAYNDINNIQKLEDKIKTIGNLCKKQKEINKKAIEYIKEKYNKYVTGCKSCFFSKILPIIYRPSGLRQRCFQRHPYDGYICRQHRSDARRQHHPDQHSEPGSQPWRLPYPRHHC